MGQVRQRARRGQALSAVRLVTGTELVGKVTKPRVWHLPDSHLYLGGAGGLLETCLPLSQAWKKNKGSRCSCSTGGEGCEGLPTSTPAPPSCRPPVLTKEMGVEVQQSFSQPLGSPSTLRSVLLPAEGTPCLTGGGFGPGRQLRVGRETRMSVG